MTPEDECVDTGKCVNSESTGMATEMKNSTASQPRPTEKLALVSTALSDGLFRDVGERKIGGRFHHTFDIWMDKLCHSEFAEGLETLSVMQTLKKYPEVMKPLFVYQGEEALTADVLEVIFDKIDYSSKDCNARGRKEKEDGYWRDFIMDIKGNEHLKLTDILMFGTGADQVPALGFSLDPTLKFTKGFLPEANTCALQLYLPLHDTYSAFKETMIFGMINSAGIGKA